MLEPLLFRLVPSAGADTVFGGDIFGGLWTSGLATGVVIFGGWIVFGCGRGGGGGGGFGGWITTMVTGGGGGGGCGFELCSSMKARMLASRIPKMPA